MIPESTDSSSNPTSGQRANRRVLIGAAAAAALAGDAGGLAAGAVATVLGLNSEGLPLCLFHASQINTRDIENTTHNRVRRISVMEKASSGSENSAGW